VHTAALLAGAGEQEAGLGFALGWLFRLVLVGWVGFCWLVECVGWVGLGFCVGWVFVLVGFLIDLFTPSHFLP